MLNDFGYIDKAIANIKEVAEKQEANIKAAAKLMADAIADDKLINVYAGGGHTTLAMGEMFFRAGGLANINPLMETALSVFNQALKYLELERTVNFGASIISAGHSPARCTGPRPAASGSARPACRRISGRPHRPWRCQSPSGL